MEDMLKAILSKIDNESLNKMGQQANASPEQAKSALANAIPVLMNALAKNSSTNEGASSLKNAISRDHDGSILDNLGGFLNDPSSANGSGILKHILGDKRQNVEQYISKGTGVNSLSASKIMEMAAPLVMGYLGKQSKSGKGGAVDVQKMLGTYLKAEKKQAPQTQSVINQLLNRDKDGSIADDIAEMGMSFLKKMMKK